MSPFRYEMFIKKDNKFEFDNLTEIHDPVADAMLQAVEVVNDFKYPVDDNKTLIRIREISNEELTR
jgi:hypothetical protein